jgi:uncharacterized membrane protein
MRKFELFVILGLTATQIILAICDITGPFRVVSGFIFLTILPGYVLLSFFYRTKLDNLGLLAHLVLSIPVSLAVISTLGLMTNFLSIGLEIIPNVTWMSTFILFFASISYFRRSKEKRYNRRSNHFLLIIGSLMILFALNFSLSDVDEHSESPYLRLYVLNNESLTNHYPNQVQVSTPVEILLGVEYGGNTIQQFTLTSSHGSKIRLSLSPGETWTEFVKVTLNKRGLHEVTWKLYQEGQSVPKREIRLWMTVN